MRRLISGRVFGTAAVKVRFPPQFSRTFSVFASNTLLPSSQAALFGRFPSPCAIFFDTKQCHTNAAHAMSDAKPPQQLSVKALQRALDKLEARVKRQHTPLKRHDFADLLQTIEALDHAQSHWEAADYENLCSSIQALEPVIHALLRTVTHKVTRMKEIPMHILPDMKEVHEMTELLRHVVKAYARHRFPAQRGLHMLVEDCERRLVALEVAAALQKDTALQKRENFLSMTESLFTKARKESDYEVLTDEMFTLLRDVSLAWSDREVFDWLRSLKRILLLMATHAPKDQVMKVADHCKEILRLSREVERNSSLWKKYARSMLGGDHAGVPGLKPELATHPWLSFILLVAEHESIRSRLEHAANTRVKKAIETIADRANSAKMLSEYLKVIPPTSFLTIPLEASNDITRGILQGLTTSLPTREDDIRRKQLCDNVARIVLQKYKVRTVLEQLLTPKLE